MSNNKQQLKQLTLPAVRAGMPVRESDINKIFDTINTIQRICGVDVTKFLRVAAGDPATAVLFNKIYSTVDTLADDLSLEVKWSHFPVRSGGPMTETLFNELVGTINLIVFKLQHNDVDVKDYVVLHQIRNKLTSEQLRILDNVWEYYLKNGKEIPARLLYSSINSPNAKGLVEDIGGGFIYETRNDGLGSYTLSFLGVMQTAYYFDIESVLLKYFGFVKQKYQSDPECGALMSEEINDALELTCEQSKVLRKAINLGGFFHGSMGWDDGCKWSAGFSGGC